MSVIETGNTVLVHARGKDYIGRIAKEIDLRGLSLSEAVAVTAPMGEKIMSQNVIVEESLGDLWIPRERIEEIIGWHCPLPT